MELRPIGRSDGRSLGARDLECCAICGGDDMRAMACVIARILFVRRITARRGVSYSYRVEYILIPANAKITMPCAIV